MADRLSLLLFCGLLLTLIQPALQGGKCVLQVDPDDLCSVDRTQEQVQLKAESFIKTSAGVFFFFNSGKLLF